MKLVRFSALAALAAAACLALTACGGSSSSLASGGTGTGASGSVSPSSSTSLAAFQSCLKSHGVKVTPGTFPSGGTRPFASGSPRPHPTGSFTRRPGGFPSSSADSAAYKACAKYEPAGFARGGFGGGFTGITASALAAFKSCMSSNGVKVTGTTAQQIFASLRNATGKTAAADKTCRVLIQPAATPSPSS
jgi:hypothetical protein